MYIIIYPAIDSKGMMEIFTYEGKTGLFSIFCFGENKTEDFHSKTSKRVQSNDHECK